jgi:hypothetical protein
MNGTNEAPQTTVEKKILSQEGTRKNTGRKEGCHGIKNERTREQQNRKQAQSLGAPFQTHSSEHLDLV